MPDTVPVRPKTPQTALEIAFSHAVAMDHARRYAHELGQRMAVFAVTYFRTDNDPWKDRTPPWRYPSDYLQGTFYYIVRR